MAADAPSCTDRANPDLIESGREFARHHPDRAEHLALSDPRYRDPHVQRLMESFAFLTGRVRQRLDDDFSLLFGWLCADEAEQIA